MTLAETRGTLYGYLDTLKGYDMKLKPVLKKDLQDPLHPTHRDKHPTTGYYEQMKRYSDQMSSQLVELLTSANVKVHAATLDQDYTEDIDLFINGTVPISLKTPTVVRDSQPIELLREDRYGQWRASWGMTTASKYFIWYSPDCSLLVASVSEVQQYILANVHPLTNNSLTTRKKLMAQSRPSNVVNRWLTLEELTQLPSTHHFTTLTTAQRYHQYFSKLGVTAL